MENGFKYCDINPGFGMNIYSSDIYDIRDILFALDRLFKTKKGECPFNRNYGSSLYSLLFESSGSMNIMDVKVLLTEDINTWEPRVELSPLDLEIEKINNNTYSVKCYFTVPSLNNQAGNLTSTITKD